MGLSAPSTSDPGHPIVEAMARALDGAISECNRAVYFVRAIGNVANA